MIIGVTGPIAAGTDSFANFLIEKGFLWFSYSDVLREEMIKQGIPLERMNIISFANSWRKKEGTGVLSKKIISKMHKGKNYVIGNIRNPGEVEELRKSGERVILVHVDAPLEKRFERARRRNRERDPQTFEDFKKLDTIDLGVGQQEYGQQHAAVFKMADYKIMNDGSIEDLRNRVYALLSGLGAKA